MFRSKVDFFTFIKCKKKFEQDTCLKRCCKTQCCLWCTYTLGRWGIQILYPFGRLRLPEVQQWSLLCAKMEKWLAFSPNGRRGNLLWTWQVNNIISYHFTPVIQPLWLIWFVRECAFSQKMMHLLHAHLVQWNVSCNLVISLLSFPYLLQVQCTCIYQKEKASTVDLEISIVNKIFV